MKTVVYSLLAFCISASTFAQSGLRYPTPQTSQCGCSPVGGCSPSVTGDIRVPSQNLWGQTGSIAESSGDRLVRLAQSAGYDIQTELRNARFYADLLDDASRVRQIASRIRQSEARRTSNDQVAELVADALISVRRMYNAVRDDGQALRSTESVRTLGRELVALGRTIQTNRDPIGPSQAGRISIPNEMKGIALLPEGEQSAALRQRICPVTGGPLGSMGKPILTQVAGRSVYVCCEGCISSLQANPAKYLAQLEPSRQVTPSRNRSLPPTTQVSIPENMKGVRLLPQSEQVLAMRQKTCPVMRTPLGSMGKPVRVNVAGRTVFVCCQGCVDSLKANPSKYLR